MSHPVRVRGLKLLVSPPRIGERHVAPRAGAWIETESFRLMDVDDEVAPRAGAWIETAREFPSDGCRRVAPRAGAWIETVFIDAKAATTRRTPCGCVD